MAKPRELIIDIHAEKVIQKIVSMSDGGKHGLHTSPGFINRWLGGLTLVR
ncbi:MAG: hypothetical protein ACKO5E_05530 [bacterium]